MQIELKNLRSDNSVWKVQDSVEIPEVVKENPQVSSMEPVTVNLTVTKSGHMFRVKGDLHTRVEYICSRCLDPNPVDLQTELDESFTDLDNEALDAEDEVHFAEGGTILFDPYIKQALDLALEYCPLCEPECKGLCSKCGCNLNRSECACDTRAIDPRFAALEDLILKDDSE